jgi:hypothetical protein
VDAELIRGLAVGQAAYIYRGGVSYVQVKRLVAEPAQLGTAPVTADPAPAAAAPQPRAAGESAEPAGAPPLADIGPLLDQAFGPEPR